MKRITVLGMGYIGFPTALLLANSGYKVFGFDIDQNRINSLKLGKLPFKENGLEELFKKVKRKKTFKPVSGLEASDAFIIAVPTPHLENKLADLSYILRAINSIREVMEDGNLIILESTIGVNDCDKQIIPLLKKKNKRFLFAHVPEKAIPGNTLYEMVNNGRVIGALTKEAAAATKDIYSSFVKGKIFITTPKIAAAAKVMENTYRDVNIALANEFAKIAEDLGFNVWEAIELANKHPRVNIHQPGPGVGGHCIPIDPWFFVGESVQAELIKKARNINDSMPQKVAKDVEKLIEKLDLKNITIAILGYAYKKNVDDARETPAKKVYQLLSKKYKVLIHDFYVRSNFVVSNELNQILKQSQVAVLLTDHDEYKKIIFRKYPNFKIVYDTRNFFSIDNLKGSAAKLFKLGKGPNENPDSH